MSERVQFRERREPVADPRATRQLVVMVVLCAAALATARSFWPVPSGVPSLVEVRGEVPRPGLHTVDQLTLHAALRAAGADPGMFPDRALAFGDRVVMEGGEASVRPPSDPLLVGLPIDPNTAEAHALAAVPGISDAQAQAIVDWRVAHGPFRTLADLEQVPGIGPATRKRLAPFVSLPP